MTAALPFLVLAIVLAAASNVLLRRGMSSLAAAPTLVATLGHALKRPSVWAGSIGYAAAMGVWLQVLARVEIGLVYPMFTGGVTVLVMVASVVALGERLGWRSVVGAVLMIAGIFVAYME